MPIIIICLYFIIGGICAITYIIYLLMKKKQDYFDDFPYYLLVTICMPVVWIVEIPIIIYFEVHDND